MSVEIAFGDVGDVNQFLIKLAAFFSDGNHVDDGTREQPLAVGEALAELATLLNAADGVSDGIHEDLITDGFARDVQTLDQWDTRAEESAEHAAEAGHRELGDQRADDIRTQYE